MNLYLRLLRILFAGSGGERLHYAEPVDTRFRVWLHDLDLFGHMNNGRYLQIMDVARAHWMMRTEVANAIRRNRWAAVIGGGFIRYRHSLRVLQSYHVRTRLLCWDTHWFYLEHSFLDRKDRCVARGVSRAGLRDRSGWVTADRVADEVHPGARSPDAPDYVADWLDLEERMFNPDPLDSGNDKQPVLSRAV